MDLTTRLNSALDGRYRVEREIGHGGMATVYLARDLKHERHVALKVLRPDLAAYLGTERFLSEIRVTANLQHPHILPLFDSGEAEGLLFYAMPFVTGGTLRHRLDREGQLPLAEALRVTTAVAGALEHAHAHGVLHRDLKPENILFQDDVPLLADFGIARAVSDAGGERLTRTGLFVGTVHYASPEQLTGQVALGPASDVYSLAAVAYELLSGAPPFSGPTMESVMARLLTEQPRALRGVRSDVGPALDAALLKALSKHPSERQPSASAFATSLYQLQVTGAWPRMLRHARGPALAVALAAVLASAMVGVPALLSHDGGTVTVESRPIQSIAVLPFVNMSSEADDHYFSDGVTEELLTLLVRVPGLRVAARSSSFAFRDDALSVQEIGRRLGVEAVLEGSVRRDGARLRITAQLVDATTGFHLWSNSYDREVAEVLDVQEELAHSIAEALDPRLAESRTQTAVRRNVDPEAHDLYLRGRQQLALHTEPSLNRAAAHFRSALERDSTYAVAWAGLAAAYDMLVEMRGGDFAARARAAVLRALELDPDLPEARTTLGNILLYHDWNFEAAEREFSRAVAAAPGDATALLWYGVAQKMAGEYDRSVELLRRANSLDPLSVSAHAHLVNSLTLAGRFDEATVEGESLLRFAPDDARTHVALSRLYLARDQIPEAVMHAERALEVEPERFYLGGFAMVFALAGREDEARAILRQMEQEAERSGDPTLTLRARIHAALGENERAFSLLEEAFQRRESLLVSLDEMWRLSPTRPLSILADPRFDDLRRRVGLPGATAL